MKQQMWKSVKVFCEIYSRCTFSNPCPTWLASILSSVLCCVQQVFKPGHSVMRNWVPWVGELPKRAACEASGSSINMTLIWSFIRFLPSSAFFTAAFQLSEFAGKDCASGTTISLNECDLSVAQWGHWSTLILQGFAWFSISHKLQRMIIILQTNVRLSARASITYDIWKWLEYF